MNNKSAVFLATICCIIAFSVGRLSVNRSPEKETVQRISRDPASGSNNPHSSNISQPPRLHEAQSSSEESNIIPNDVRMAWANKIHQEEIARNAQAMTDRESVFYNPLFARLGLTPDQAEERLKRLTQIHQHSTQVNDSLTELLSARYLYDASMKQMLSEERYKEYREWERTKPAMLESQRIKDFLAQNNIIIRDDAALIGAIDKNDAVLFQQTHTAYGGIPEVVVGDDNAGVQITGDIKRLRASSSALLSSVAQDFPAETVNKIKMYYENYISELTSTLARIRDSKKPSP